MCIATVQHSFLMFLKTLSKIIPKKQRHKSRSGSGHHMIETQTKDIKQDLKDKNIHQKCLSWI